MRLEPRREVQYVDVTDLAPWERNPRSITVARFQALKAALSAEPLHLLARPIVCLPDARVIAGNMRQRAGAELASDEDEAFLACWPGGRVPVLVVDVPEERALAWALRDNNEYGEWDDQLLHELMVELQGVGYQLDLTGFPTGDVQLILEGVGPGSPVQFRRFDVDDPTAYECPHCGYEWSGSPKPRGGVPRQPEPEAAGA